MDIRRLYLTQAHIDTTAGARTQVQRDGQHQRQSESPRAARARHGWSRYCSGEEVCRPDARLSL